MATLTSKDKLIIKTIKAKFGVPAIKIEIQESEIFDYYIAPALINYYTAAPYMYRIELTDSGNGVSTTPPDLTTILNLENAEAFFIGTTYISKAPATEGSLAYLSNYIPGVIDDEGHRMLESMEQSIMQDQDMANTRDLNENDLIVQYDDITNKINVSPFNGKVSLQLGYGFSTTQYVPWAHIEVLSLLATERLAESLKAARGSLKIPGDVEINEAVLDDILSNTREKLPKLMISINTPLLLYA